MIKCWASEAKLRPSFAELVEELSSLLDTMAEYLGFSVSAAEEKEDETLIITNISELSSQNQLSD